MKLSDEVTSKNTKNAYKTLESRFIQKHGDKFDYSESIYFRSNVKIKIFCKEHKEYFYQEPNAHLKGNGCPTCIKLKHPKECLGNNFKKIDKKALIGTNLIYDSIKYLNDREILITCSKHGQIRTNKNNNIKNFCKQCKVEKNKLKNTISFISKGNSKFNFIFDYSRFD